MTLRHKTLLIVGVALVASTVLYHSVATLLARRELLAVEKELVRGDVMRAVAAVGSAMDDLDTLCGGWASRDDTFAFMETRDLGYLRSNLPTVGLAEANLAVVVFVDPAGRLVAETAVDCEAAVQVPVPEHVHDLVTPTGPLARAPDSASGVTGVAVVDGRPMLLAARPILTSERRGPARGTLVMGRWLGSRETDRLSRLTHLALSFRLADDPDLPPDWRAARSRLALLGAPPVQRSGPDTVAGYGVITDLEGRPAVLARVEVPRTLYHHGRRTVRVMVGAVFATGLLLALGTLLLLERSVLAPLGRLTRGVSRVGAARDPAGRVSSTGNDELGSLAGEINRMLTALEEAQRERDRAEAELRASGERYLRMLELDKEELERRVRERTAELEHTVQQLESEAAERERADEQARHADTRFRGLADFLPQPVLELDVKGVPTFVNRAAQEWYGVGWEDSHKRLPVIELLASGERARGIDSFRRVLAGEPVRGEEFTVVRADGSAVPVLAFSSRIAVDGEAIGTRLLAVDISDIKLAEDALRRSERYYRGLFEGAHDSILVVEPELGLILDANARASQLYGVPQEELIGLTVDAFARDPTTDLVRLRRAHERGAVVGFETVHRRRDGSEVVLEVNASRVEHGNRSAVLTICRDVSDRRSLEDRLRQAEKLEAVGRLAAGVAHDFNNLLTVVLGSAELALRRLGEGREGRKEVADIRQAALRGRDLTHSLLGYSRRQVLAREYLDLRTVVEGMTSMLCRVLPESIVVDVHQDDTPTTVTADRGQLEQVLMNLCVNARDAMPGGGRLSISVETVTLAEDFLAERSWARAGRYGRLRVRDTGTGMDRAVLARVFEPFFTTKERGAGSGMGLAMVFGTVKQHAGMVDIQSEPGAGTTVDVYLPVSVDDSAITASGPHLKVTDLPLGQGERVLVVEDQPQLRPVVERILAELGYRVSGAGDGLEAAVVAAAEPGGFDLVVSDLVMPHLGGIELYERLAARGRPPRFLFTSGYDEDAQTARLPQGPHVAFLAKPYDLEALAATIRSLLDAPDA